MIDALESALTPAPVATRVAAVVQASVFDAINGVTRRFAAYRVTPAAPPDTDPGAAVVGAAHQALVSIFPAQAASFDALEAATLGELADPGSPAVLRGLAWGASVADEIRTERAGDGFTTVPPPYLSSPDPGRWQPTPPLFAPPAFRQFAAMTPWVISAPDAFRPPAPPASTSARYARDYEEVRSQGSVTSTARSAADTQTAQLWASDVPAAIWDRIADSLLEKSARTATDAARTLALTNLAMADALISIWNSKNYYDTWRPITAIRAGATDANAATAADAAWVPLLVTPPFQEYPAGHPGVSQAAATVLSSTFGNATTFTVTSAQLPGVARIERSFAQATAQVVDARVFGGIHFRFAGEAALTVGHAIGRHVLATAMLRRPCSGSGGPAAGAAIARRLPLISLAPVS